MHAITARDPTNSGVLFSILLSSRCSALLHSSEFCWVYVWRKHRTAHISDNNNSEVKIKITRATCHFIQCKVLFADAVWRGCGETSCKSHRMLLPRTVVYHRVGSCMWLALCISPIFYFFARVFCLSSECICDISCMLTSHTEYIRKFMIAAYCL